MEITDFQPIVVGLLQSINERLGILIDQNVAQVSLARGKSAFQTSDMIKEPAIVASTKFSEGGRVDPSKATDNVIDRIPDPLDAEIRLHMSHDEPIN
jgi:hypothetical protein